MTTSNNPITVGKSDTIYSGTKKIQKSDNTWWLKTVTLLIFLIGFSALDGVTLYPVFEYIFASSQVLLYFTTVGTAVAINFLPCIAARAFLRSKYGLEERNYVFFYISIALFSVIFIALAVLRFATADAVIGNISGFMSSSSGNTVDDSSVPGATAMVCTQMFTNLITSAIAFFLSYFSENPVKMRLNAIELQIADWEERFVALNCAKTELDLYDSDALIKSEQVKHRLAHEALNARGEGLKREADKQLEMLLGSADANTHITDAQNAEDSDLTARTTEHTGTATMEDIQKAAENTQKSADDTKIQSD